MPFCLPCGKGRRGPPDLYFLDQWRAGGCVGRGLSSVQAWRCGLAHAIRMEEKQNGIRTCVICPGLVNTELLEKRPVKPSPEELAKALLAEDVAETILHVAKLPVRASIPELILLPATQ